MELQYIEKKENGKYIKRYDLHYKTREGNEKIYEMEVIINVIERLQKENETLKKEREVKQND